jgi:septum formation protein
VEEISGASMPPGKTAMANARIKAAFAAKAAGPPAFVIAADTLVALGGETLGKPVDEEGAARMLRLLSGKTHTVYTGVSLVCINNESTRRKTFVEKARVTVKGLTEAEIRGYVRSGEPMDKAGAYGAQGLGSFLVTKVSGDYNTVVGLPLARLYKEARLLAPSLFNLLD